MRIPFYWLLLFVASVCVSLGSGRSYALTTVDDSDRPLLIVYDSSNSMWAELGDATRKYEAGRSAIEKLISSSEGTGQLGFRAYGHRDKTSCRDSELLVPISDRDDAADQITQKVTSIRPTGKTPISYSLKEGLKDLEGRDGDILLVSDGIETCDVDPCDLMRQWQASNIDVRVHVVGVGIREFERPALACIADISGGIYYDAETQGELESVLLEAGQGVEVPVSLEKEIEPSTNYELIITAADETGRSYLARGQLLQDGKVLTEVSTNGKTQVFAPGNYTVRLGPVLRDGNIYKPVETEVVVSEPGETRLSVTVERPAIVSVVFYETEEPHPGALVRAYQNGREVFTVRPFDEALAAPGEYEFRTTPNADNELKVVRQLMAREESVIRFDLVKTIRVYFEFVLSDGTVIRRPSELWRDNELLYKVHSGNGALVQPGDYVLKSEDQNLPLSPLSVNIDEDGKVISIPLKNSSIIVSYSGNPDAYVSTPDRAFLESLDRGGRGYLSLDTSVAVVPGKYKVHPQSNKGFFDPVEIDVREGEVKSVSFEPQAVGQIIVNYSSSGEFIQTPDRAFVEPLEAQRIINGFMTPGQPRKFLPGKYLVKGWRVAGDFEPLEVMVRGGETTSVTLVAK